MRRLDFAAAREARGDESQVPVTHSESPQRSHGDRRRAADAASVPKTDRRIAQARQLFDDDVVAGHRYGAASKSPNFRQHLERRAEPGDLREDLLGSADNLSVLDA